MDAWRFDRITRALGQSGWTRRGLARALAGLVILPMSIADANQIVFGSPSTTLEVGLALYVVGTALSIGLVAAMMVSWRRGWWRTAGRVCLTLVAVAALGTVAWLYQWNLIGWRF